MIDRIATFGPLLAGIAALTALMVGLTKGTRLRRREELLRSSLEIIPVVTDSHSTVKLCHRATMAQILSRETAGTWPFVIPWLIWLISILLFGNIGFATASSLASNPTISTLDLSYEVFGEGGLAGILTMLTYLTGLSLLAFRQMTAFEDRASIAKHYFDHGKLLSMRSLREDRILVEWKSRTKINSRPETVKKTTVQAKQALRACKKAVQIGDAANTAPLVCEECSAAHQESKAVSDSPAKAKGYSRCAQVISAIGLIALPGIVVGTLSFMGGFVIKSRLVLQESGEAVPNFAAIGAVGSLIIGVSLPLSGFLLQSWKHDVDVRMKLFPL